MLMEEFSKWCNENDVDPDNDRNFADFFHMKYKSIDLAIWPIMVSLAREIHDLQVCMEGLIEDSER